MIWDILIIVGAVAVVVSVSVAAVLRKKKGIPSCGCGCASCPHAGACPSHKKAPKKDEK